VGWEGVGRSGRSEGQGGRVVTEVRHGVMETEGQKTRGWVHMEMKEHPFMFPQCLNIICDPH
jgi:hypothetical protein